MNRKSRGATQKIRSQAQNLKLDNDIGRTFFNLTKTKQATDQNMIRNTMQPSVILDRESSVSSVQNRNPSEVYQMQSVQSQEQSDEDIETDEDKLDKLFKQ